MPLSAKQLANRLWDGSTPIEEGRTLALVPTVDSDDLLRNNAASLDLRPGRWFRTMQHTRLTSIEISNDEAKSAREGRITREHYIRFDDCFVLHPGQFVIGTTLEWLKFPNDLSGYVTGKSSWGRRGLIIETAAGIHPGFTGCLTLELANVGAAPIKLNPGMQVCQVFFHDVKNDDGGGAATQFVGYRKPGLGRVIKDAVARALGDEYFG